MNEFLFLAQVLVIIVFAIGALRLGKGALVSWVAVNALVANIFVLKQITLLGFHVTASDAYMIGSLLGLNFLQEYFGREEAQKATWICFFFMFFFVLVSQLHLFYLPSSFDTTQDSFQQLLSVSPRLMIASLSVFFIVQQFDIRFFALLKKVWPGLNLAFRMAISLVISQFIDTVLFSFAGLYGIVASVLDVIVLSFAIKLAVIFFFTPFIKWAKSS